MTTREQTTTPSPRVLLVYFSLSSQTKNLIQAIGQGLENRGITVTQERLVPREPLQFPIGTVPRTVSMMLLTFFRQRVAIEALAPHCFEDHDLIILAGPTWSYNPSGPVLSLFDRDGERLFRGRRVLPLISCRGYWRTHWYGLLRLLRKRGAIVVNRIVFSHTNPEPWRTIGVFLKLAGRTPERAWLISTYYRKYGHTREQVEEAARLGEMIGQALLDGRPLEGLSLT